MPPGASVTYEIHSPLYEACAAHSISCFNSLTPASSLKHLCQGNCHDTEGMIEKGNFTLARGRTWKNLCFQPINKKIHPL